MNGVSDENTMSFFDPAASSNGNASDGEGTLGRKVPPPVPPKGSRGGDENMSEEDRRRFMENMSEEDKRRFMENMSEEDRRRFIQNMSEEDRRRFMQNMSEEDRRRFMENDGLYNENMVSQHHKGSGLSFHKYLLWFKCTENGTEILFCNTFDFVQCVGEVLPCHQYKCIRVISKQNNSSANFKIIRPSQNFIA